MNGHLIIIPFIAKEAQGRELEFALKGWKRHFQAPAHIVVVGDYVPACGIDGVEFINCPRIEPVEGQYLPHLDIINKIDTALRHFPEYDQFCYSCDDIYAVNDFGPEEIMFPKVQDAVMPIIEGDESNGWWRDLEKTRRRCVEWGYETRNWVCHLPVMYDRVKYEAILAAHNCRKESFVVENLYYNCYYANRVPLVLGKGNNLKFPIQGAFNSADIDRAFREKIWIYNSEGGWCKELEDKLEQHFK